MSHGFAAAEAAALTRRRIQRRRILKAHLMKQKPRTIASSAEVVATIVVTRVVCDHSIGAIGGGGGEGGGGLGDLMRIGVEKTYAPAHATRSRARDYSTVPKACYALTASGHRGSRQ